MTPRSYIAHLEDWVTAGELLRITHKARIDTNTPGDNRLLSPSSLPYTQILIQTPSHQQETWVYGVVPRTLVGSQVRLTESSYELDNGRVVRVQRLESVGPIAQEIFNQIVLEKRN